MTFVDESVLEVRAGDGGRGCVAFRREKFVPRGGPSGGDGGHGGSIWLVAELRVTTLLKFRYQHRFVADRGRHGLGSNKTGADGADTVITVPVGTVVRDAESSEIKADLTEPGTRILIARGGRGGRGNARFATSTHQAPKHAEPGEEGEEGRYQLTLKLFADVGLVGLPNAGKSSFLARVTAAKPKIADYPFTTIAPHLGVVRLDDDRAFVVADIPGLIEGAHAGHGLGDRFLRHIERTRLLLHLIDAADPEVSPTDAFDVVRRELSLAPGGLHEKPFVVALNKMDAAQGPDAERARQALAARGIEVLTMSAVTGQGVGEVLNALAARLPTPCEAVAENG